MRIEVPIDDLDTDVTELLTGATGTKTVSDQAARTGADIGARLWSMANTLRAAGVRPADYQVFILPLLMYKVVNDRYDEAHREALANPGDGYDDPEEYWNDFKEILSSFVIPDEVRFTSVRATAQNIGEALTSALTEVEKGNNELAGVFLGTDYAELKDKAVGELLTILSSVSFSLKETSQDALGQAYEYLLQKFADESGAKAGQFFTPISVAKLLCLLTDPQPGETGYDPTCGSGGLLNTLSEHMVEMGHNRGEIATHGQEIDAQSFAIASINNFLHGNSGEVRRGDTLADPKFVDDESLTRFDVLVANPPFGLANTAADTWMSDHYGRFQWGAVPKKPAELAFVAHMASSMKGVVEGEEKTGRAAVVLPMGALFRKGVEATLRKNLVEAGLVDAVIALPNNLFYNTSIPAAILVLRTQPRHAGQVLFVDASQAFVKGKKRNDVNAASRGAIVEAYTKMADSDTVKAKLIDTSEVLENDGDLSVQRYVSTATVVETDVPSALAALQAAERSALEARESFWAQLKGAGYSV